MSPMIAAASSTCIADISTSRLVTCGAPATAASTGADSIRATRYRIARGCMCVSASVTITSPCRARANPTVELLGFAAVDGVAQHVEASVAARRLDRRRLGVVGGAVVEDQHLELRVVGAKRRPHAGGDHRLLVVGRDQDAHPGPAAFRLQQRIA